MKLDTINDAYKAEDLPVSFLTAPLRSYYSFFKEKVNAAPPNSWKRLGLNVGYILTGCIAVPIFGTLAFIGTTINWCIVHYYYLKAVRSEKCGEQALTPLANSGEVGVIPLERYAPIDVYRKIPQEIEEFLSGADWVQMETALSHCVDQARFFKCYLEESTSTTYKKKQAVFFILNLDVPSTNSLPSTPNLQPHGKEIILTNSHSNEVARHSAFLMEHLNFVKKTIRTITHHFKFVPEGISCAASASEMHMLIPIPDQIDQPTVNSFISQTILQITDNSITDSQFDTQNLLTKETDLKQILFS